jgi:sodium/potassium/calcium exchanger 6
MNNRALLETVQRWRRPRYSARPFALTLLAIALISLLAWAKDHHSDPLSLSLDTTYHKRDLSAPNQECRLVHHATDKCAFVLANCPDEEAGVISYLTFYYCRMPHAKPVAFTIMTLWLALLFSTIGIAASDFFCVNLNTIANMLGMSESLAGVTLLAFGNGSPDVFSTFAAFRTHAASLAVGELIGAASFITAVVSGSMALIRPFDVARKSFVRDVGFFIVAAGFSMGFVADGKLHLWESVAMVVFYLFYVAFVVCWHWWINQRKARRQKAAAVRSHYITPGGDEAEISEYHDDEIGPLSRASSHTVSVDDFSALERAGAGDPVDDDEYEEERERWMGEMTSNMRVSRPRMGARRNTHTPIRPSLVGALEFRAVLSSLQKSRNIQSMPINLRRYSDDPTYTTVQQQAQAPTDSHPAPRPAYGVASTENQQSTIRGRAVSTNDIDRMRLQSYTIEAPVPNINFISATPNFRGTFPPIPDEALPSPSISLSPSPASSPLSSRTASPAPPRTRHPSTDLLAPPSLTRSPSPRTSPVLEPGERPVPPSLKLTVPDTMSPPIPFPAYTDFPWSAHSSSRAPSLRLPSPSASPESTFHQESFFGAYDLARTPKWWPSRVFPPPHLLLSTLFPTLTNWRDKSIADKILGFVAALPVFLLTITLPVAEQQKDDDDEVDAHADWSLPPPLTPLSGASVDMQQRNMTMTAETLIGADSSRSSKGKKTHGRNSASTDTTATARSQPPQLFITSENNLLGSPEQLPTSSPSNDSKQWNRWLVITQIFTAPLFLVLIIWANLEESMHTLFRHTLWSLLASLCILAPILATTSPDHAPRWRPVLCFLGFAVAIAWISTIANEVVGVLRTLGVILNMSDAILGLTIFAVGNSLGDLVADITVARLGFPVMALSACFGGPMLNILLGIGLSGSYMILTKGEDRHHRHPHEPVHFKPYHIAVSTTLIISGASLLVTLVGLLIAVPVRRWRMDKWIGWGLVVTWGASTAVNVLVEVLGYSSAVS